MDTTLMCVPQTKTNCLYSTRKKIDVIWYCPLSQTTIILEHPAVLTCKKSSQLDLVIIYTICHRGVERVTWVPSSSIPPVVYNSTLTTTGFGKELEYIDWWRLVDVVPIYVAMGKSPFLMGRDFPECPFYRMSTHTPVNHPLSMLPK